MAGLAWLWILAAAGAAAAAGDAQEEQKPLRVTSKLDAPYLTIRANASNDTSNDQYEGFIKDLLDGVSNITGRQYTIQVVADGRYGRYNDVDGTASGMIGEVLRGEADVAAAPLVYTLARERAVDFLLPFYEFEATVVLRRRAPEQRPVIRTLEELVGQDQVDYGVLKGGAIAKVLWQSEDPLHQAMWERINNVTWGLQTSNNAGVARARGDARFAFLLEGSLAEYAVRNPPCDLQAFPAGFYQREYAMAVANQSPLRDELNEAMDALRRSRALDDLYDKWFGEDQCSAAPPSTAAAAGRYLLMLMVIIALVL